MPLDIALIGMMGAGKSTVARHLSQLMRRDVVATDDLVQQRAGKPIPEIFGDDGEQAFRALEHGAIAHLADAEPPHRRIVDLGGGAVLDDRNVENLARHAVLVHLDAPVGTLVSRLAEESTGRPLLFGSDIAETLRALVEQRGQRYREVADVTIAADQPVAAVALEILRWAASRQDVLSIEERRREGEP